MIELTNGNGILIHKAIETRMLRSKDGGQVVRVLMGVLFNKQDLVTGTLDTRVETKNAPDGLRMLDPRILNAIFGRYLGHTAIYQNKPWYSWKSWKSNCRYVWMFNFALLLTDNFQPDKDLFPLNVYKMWRNANLLGGNLFMIKKTMFWLMEKHHEANIRMSKFKNTFLESAWNIMWHIQNNETITCLMLYQNPVQIFLHILNHWPLGNLTYSRKMIFKLILVIYGWCILYEIALRCMSLDIIDDYSILVQAIVWCHKAPSHYLIHGLPRSMSLYGITRPQ